MKTQALDEKRQHLGILQAELAKITAAADVYALGVLVYLLIAGHLPFARTRDQAFQPQRLKPERLVTFAPDVPREVDDLVVRMMLVGAH